MKYLTFLFILSFFSACNQKQEAVQGQWIKGNEQEKLETIENQFRGFDMAMVETGYRYQELYWAGQDENWEYADYQLEKTAKIDAVIKIYDRVKVKERVNELIKNYFDSAIDSLNSISVSSERKVVLYEIAEKLMNRNS